MAAVMAHSNRPHEYRAPLIASLVLHALIVLAMGLNLSLCSHEVKLPPVPAHVQAVVLERTAVAPPAAPEVELPVAEPPPPPKPEVQKPEPKKPAVKPVPKKPEPKKPEAKKPEPKKPEPKKVEVKAPEPKPVVKPPPPDFGALLEQEEQARTGSEASRRAASEQAARDASARAAADAKVVADYMARMQREIIRRWNRPPGARSGMTTVLRIQLFPGGELQNVELVKSSGDAAFDRAAENAVRLAGRLPVPTDPALFNRSFRQFTFTFDPRDLAP